MCAPEQNPLPLNGGNTGFPPFMVTMLRLARILTAKEPERSEISTRQLSRLMHRYSHLLPRTYTAKEIVEHFDNYGSEMEGAGVKVTWNQIMPEDDRKMALYEFRIQRLNEPVRTTTG